MNICFITSEYINPFRGGIERVTYDLYNALSNYGHCVYVLSKEQPIQDTEKVDENCKSLPDSNVCSVKNKEYLICFFKKHKIGFVVNNSHHQSVFDLLLLCKKEYSFKLISAIHTDSNAIIKNLRDSWDWDCNATFLSVKIKRIYFFYYLCRYLIKYYLRKKAQHQWYAKLYKDSDAIVLLSERYIPEFLKILGIHESYKIFAIANPIKKRRDENWKQKEKMVIWVGRMEQYAKRPDRIIKIWEELEKQFQEWKLYMIGDGPLRGDLEKYCNSKKLNSVIFTGKTDPKLYYERAEILCLTSTYEGFGVVLTEALEYGVIPFAFDSYTAVRDIIVTGQNGFLIRPFELKQYACSLSTLLANDLLRNQIRDNITSLDAIKQFDIELIVKKWIILFENLRLKNYD